MQYDIYQLEVELERLDEFEGLEIRLNPIEPIWIETFRRIDGLYMEFCIARLNLLLTAKGYYPELVPQGNNEKGDIMLQYVYINNAIIWYNNCYDLLLQVVWVFYRMWDCKKSSVSTTPSDWNYEQLQNMKKECQYRRVKEWNRSNNNIVESIVIFHDSILGIKVRNWANEIKHRAPLFVKGASTKSTLYTAYYKNIEKRYDKDGKIVLDVSISDDKYNSQKSIQEFDINELVSTLIQYHKELSSCIKNCVTPILNQYNS